MSEVIEEHETPPKPKFVIGHQLLQGAIHSPAACESEPQKAWRTGTTEYADAIVSGWVKIEENGQ